MRPFERHDPDAILDYTFDWSNWLDTGETVSASTWSGPVGLTLTPALASPETTVRVEVTDADLIGTTVQIVNHVTSSDGQEDDRTLELLIIER